MKGIARATIFFSLVLVPAVVGAQAPTDDSAKARSLSEHGLGYYNVAEYDKAIQMFKESYVLAQAPGLLFNIAQAYRLKGDCEQALLFYQKYRAADSAGPKRDVVENKIDEMQRCVSAKGAPPREAISRPERPETVTPPQREVPKPVVNPTVEISAPRAGRSRVVAGGVLVGFSAIFLATAAGLSARAVGISENVAIGNFLDYDAEQADWRNSWIAAGVMYGLSGISLITGAVLLARGVQMNRATPGKFLLAPHRDGLMLSFAGTF